MGYNLRMLAFIASKGMYNIIKKYLKQKTHYLDSITRKNKNYYWL